MRFKKNIAALFIVCFSVFCMSGCSFVKQSVEKTLTPLEYKNPQPGVASPSDIRSASTIGVETIAYVDKDPRGTEADRKAIRQMVSDWQTKGATTQTVTLVLPRYRVYVENDVSLTEREKSLRRNATEGVELTVRARNPQQKIQTADPFWGLSWPQ